MSRVSSGVLGACNIRYGIFSEYMREAGPESGQVLVGRVVYGFF